LTILVTGGAGYIGSHTVRALQTKGYDVIVVDNLSKGHKQAVQVPLYIGDLSDRSFLEKVFAENQIDAVIHFAALSLVGESVVRPDLYFGSNITNALSLLDVMRKYGVRKLCFRPPQQCMANLWKFLSLKVIPNSLPIHMGNQNFLLK